MKHITKNPEPKEFKEWKAQANENWQPTFNNLRGKEKRAVFDALWIEQGHICCYCQCRLIENKCHIDHLQPQHGTQIIDSLDYSNFVCSCQVNLQKGEPRHCGNAKDNDQLPISPLDPTCESRFKFKNNGEIDTNDSSDQSAIDTINLLNLNSRNIVGDRLAVIEFFDKEIDIMDGQEIAQFIQESLEKDQEGKYQPYWTMIKERYSDFLLNTF
jgi:uncharacterized protein (TIGR02646 family)